LFVKQTGNNFFEWQKIRLPILKRGVDGPQCLNIFFTAPPQ